MRDNRLCVKITRSTAVACLLLTSTSAFSEASEAVAASTPVATVAGEPIRAQAVRRAMVKTGAAAAKRLQTLEQKEAVVEDLVRLHVLAQLAKENGYAEDPEIQEAVRMLLAERYWRDLIAEIDSPRPGDDEVRHFYEGHPEKFIEPLRMRGSVLSLRMPGKGSSKELAQVRSRADALLQQASATDSAGFADLVRKFSEDPVTRARGGDLGFVVEGASVFRIEAAVVDALFALSQAGDLSPLVVTDRAVHIIRLQERHGGEPLPLSVVANDIRRQLGSERRDQDLAQAYANLRGQFDVEIDRELLERIGPRDSDSSRPPSFPVGVPSE